MDEPIVLRLSGDQISEAAVEWLHKRGRIPGGKWHVSEVEATRDGLFVTILSGHSKDPDTRTVEL